LYNRGYVPIDVTGWSVQYASSTGSSWQKTDISGIIQPGRYYLIQQAAGSGGSVNLPTPDATGIIFMSATAGKVALMSTNVLITSGTVCPVTNVVDLVGFGGATNCSELSPTANLSNTTAALRKANGLVDNDNNSQDFRIAAPSPRNSALVDVGPYVLDTTPANGAIGVAIDANIIVHYNELVSNASQGWFSIECSLSGSHPGWTTISAVDEERIFEIDPDADFAPGDHCTVTVLAEQIFDLDPYDPPDFQAADYIFSFDAGSVCELPYTPIYDIQGSGENAAITGAVTTQGVVVGDFEGPSPTLRGFYMQDAAGDADVNTSDGIFVFNGSNNSVSVGQVVRVSGNAAEFQEQTQISAASVTNCGTGALAPTDVYLPFASSTDAERFEGMLVRMPQTLYVTEHFQLGRFGMVVMSSGDRLWQPTHLVEPGAPALTQQATNNLNRIIIDDALNNQNADPIVFGRGGLPLSASNTLRGGDTAAGIVGVMTYTWSGNSTSGNAYRLRPVGALGGGAPNFQPSNPRPLAPDEVGGTLKVLGTNVLNYFNTFDGASSSPPWACNLGVGGLLTNCRGADGLAEFDRQWPKIVAGILAIDPDVIGLNEIENDGYGPASAMAILVDQLNAATAPGTYAYIDVDAETGQVNALGFDAIKVGLIYKPGSVTPVGQTAALNSVEFVNGGDGEARSRPSLAQAFEQSANGQVFIVDVNHLKSKSSACDTPDEGDGQGNCSDVRAAAAAELLAWLAGDPTGTGDPDVLLIGDYNSYAKEDPIDVLLAGGFTNLLEALIGPAAYSYVFDGGWGNLDYAFASPEALAQVTGVTSYHINSDEPSVLDYNTNFKSAGQIVSLFSPDQYRGSDHDPIIVGLCQPPTLSVSMSAEELWPANHEYVTVEASVAASADAATITLVSVTSNEPDDGLGDGDEVNDIVILDDYTFDLRAERSALGSGREYTITYQVTNTCGATVVGSAVVSVPHNK
jgi:hypothetical protein